MIISINLLTVTYSTMTVNVFKNIIKYLQQKYTNIDPFFKKSLKNILI